MDGDAERIEDWFHNGSSKPKQYPSITAELCDVEDHSWTICSNFPQVVLIEVIVQRTRAATLPHVSI